MEKKYSMLIVIAVIAILAAVLIPTFASIIKKANMSADQQAVRQMNTFLASEGAVEAPTSISEARIILLEADIEMKDYKPLTKDMYFYWVKSENRIIYADKDNKVVFPAEFEELEYKMGDWFSLSGEIVENDDWKDSINGGVVTLKDGGSLVSLMEAYNNNDTKATAVTKITLEKDIDLMGSATNFKKITKNVEFDGNGKTVYGLCSNASVFNKNNSAGEASSYGYGLFAQIGDVTSKKTANVTVKNVTFDGAVVDDPENSAEVSGAGIVAGIVYYGSTLNIEDVAVKNCYVRAEKKAGALIGYVAHNKIGNKTDNPCTVTIKNVKVENVTVIAGREAAALIGFVQQSNLSATGLTTKNITVEADSSYGYKYSSDKLTATNDKGENKRGITSKDYWDASKATFAEGPTNFAK